MSEFVGTLNKNEIYSAVYNMIIRQDIFTDRLKVKEGLVGEAKKDAGLYGDTELFYSYDVTYSEEWKGDEEAPNLLAIKRPKDPHCQVITIDTFRMVWITLDYYLSKRAWSDEGIFSEFSAQMSALLAKTKKIHEYTTYNAFIGTTDGTALSVTIPTDADDGKLVQVVGEYLANLIENIADLSRDYNAYGDATFFDESDVKIIWNSKYKNKFKFIDLPNIYNNKDLVLDGTKLNSKYFGKVNSGAAAGDGTSVRYLKETKISDTEGRFAGELVPVGKTAEAGNSYTVDDSIICKVYIKLPPMLSAFEAGTEFTNARSLTTNRYTMWGYSEPELLDAYPFITIRKA